MEIRKQGYILVKEFITERIKIIYKVMKLVIQHKIFLHRSKNNHKATKNYL